MARKEVLKTVSFEEEQNRIHTFEEEYELPVEECWYVGGDYVHMKSSSRAEAKEWRRQGYGIILKDTFENPRPDAQDFIDAFVQEEGAQSRRGLERHLSRQHGEERSAVKDRSRQCVLVHQHRLRKQGVKYPEMSDRIGSIYKDTCRPARVFARRLGKADELVAKKGVDSSTADRIVEDFQKRNYSNKMERRLSNFSIKSGNSFDSNKSWRMGNQMRSPKARCPSSPGSPTSPTEELYAGIA
jgi:hypothetical protein